jgi:Ca2+-binding EF-hand superfamily protein
MQESIELTKLFESIINTRGIYKQLNFNESTVRSLRSYHIKGKVSLEKMREVCTKMGYKLVQEEHWS